MDALDEIELFEGQAEKPKNELSEEEVIQIHLQTSAIKLSQIIETNVSFNSLKQKLDIIDGFLNSIEENHSPTPQEKRFFQSLSTKEGMKNVFNGSQIELA